MTRPCARSKDGTALLAACRRVVVVSSFGRRCGPNVTAQKRVQVMRAGKCMCTTTGLLSKARFGRLRSIAEK